MRNKLPALLFSLISSASLAPLACSSSAPPKAPKDATALPGSDASEPPPANDSGDPPLPDSSVGLEAGKDAEPPPPVPGQLLLTTNQVVDGLRCDVFTWKDSRGKERSASLVRNDGPDLRGYFGGYLRRFTYEKLNGTPMDIHGSPADHPGWGYTINHLRGTGNLWSSLYQPGTFRQVFLGTHHAIHEFAWNAVGWPGGPVKITIHWLMTTGRDHPLWSVTYDLTGTSANRVEADDRSPYGDLQWDNGAGSNVDGVAWGDRYRFKTTGAGPVTVRSAWDYTQPNRVPHVHMWSSSADAEMGSVQTLDWTNKDAGGTWLYVNWGRTSANKVINQGTPASQTMPIDWNWPFQLNQYEITAGDTRSKRLAWGTRNGSIGSSSYAAYGDDRNLSGYPYQGHSVFMVLGGKSEGAVEAQIAQVEASLDARLVAARGSVTTSGAPGIARTDTAAYPFAGWNSNYGAFELGCDGTSSAQITMTPAGGPVKHPVFMVHGYTKNDVPDTLAFGTETLVKHVDFFPSLDRRIQTLWLTIKRTVSAPTGIGIGAPAP